MLNLTALIQSRFENMKIPLLAYCEKVVVIAHACSYKYCANYVGRKSNMTVLFMTLYSVITTSIENCLRSYDLMNDK